ncbi:MAG: DNA repair protein RecO [bacterium]
MALEKVDAIVLRSRDLRETDKIITLYSRQYGKLQTVAKGLKKIQSKLASSLEMFDLSEVMLYIKPNRGLSTITGASLKSSLYRLRQDIRRFSCASLVVELTDKLIRENQPNENIFRLLEKVLTLMQTRDPELLGLFFMVHLFASLGYKLHVTECVSCSAPSAMSARFSSREGGTLCPKCYFRDTDSVDISKECILSLRTLQTTSISKIGYIPLLAKTKKELKNILDFYLASHLPRKLSSRGFIDKIQSVVVQTGG